MPQFDIVSEVDLVEVRHATENANRELATRFDFRGVEASFEFQKEIVKLKAEAEPQLRQMATMLRGSLARHNVDAQAMQTKDVQYSGKTCSQEAHFQQGVDAATAKKIVKLIKDSKLKVQASIQGEKIRVQGKKRDDLQQVMALVRGAELGLPFQFENFRD